MTEAEQAIVALMLLEAEKSKGQKYQGSIPSLRQLTTVQFGLDKFPGAFENAIEYLIERNFLKLHRFQGVDDYASIDVSGPTSGFLKSLLPQYEKNTDSFSFDEKNPQFPIIATYLDVGGSWLIEFARALGQNDEVTTSVVNSAAWTGLYVVSVENTVKIQLLISEMKAEIETLDLDNSAKSNALAAIKALEALTEAPDPPWALIIRILQSPILANITAIAALIVTMIKA